MSHDKFVVDGVLWVITEPVGVPVYDFDFRRFLSCRTPFRTSGDLPGVARVGAFDDYADFYTKAAAAGIDLVHSVEDHLRCTLLPRWYPLIQTSTPRSRWYAEAPTLKEIEADFELPVFVKGARQTNRHQAAASVIRSASDYASAVAMFRADPVLRWQDFVCREMLDLRRVGGGVEGKIPASFEFRTFWWRGRLVGGGRYWVDATDYAWTPSERDAALAVAGHAVAALECAFLVVDLAQTTTGQWVIIECNDGMESGYAGASPFLIWQNILAIERERD